MIFDPKRSSNIGRMIVPKISIWGTGLRVSLPMFLAVGSPMRFAMKP